MHFIYFCLIIKSHVVVGFTITLGWSFSLREALGYGEGGQSDREMEQVTHLHTYIILRHIPFLKPIRYLWSHSFFEWFSYQMCFIIFVLWKVIPICFGFNLRVKFGGGFGLPYWPWNGVFFLCIVQFFLLTVVFISSSHCILYSLHHKNSPFSSCIVLCTCTWTWTLHLYSITVLFIYSKN